ncbi:TolC family protein [Rhodoflexus sp.]
MKANIRRNGVILTALAVCALIAFFYYRSSSSGQGGYLVTQVKKGDFTVAINASGELAAKKSVEIMGPQGVNAFGVYQFKISNIVPEGTSVKKGDFVAALDGSELIGKMKDRQSDLERAMLQYTQAQLDFENNLLSLKILLGNKAGLENFTLIPPTQIPDFEVDEATALAQAKNNRERFIALKRRRLEADREVARARGDNGADIMITGSLGFTQRAATIGDAYTNFQNQQLASVNLTVPIIDWGRQQARIKTAQANAEVVNSTVSQDELTFEQEVVQKVRQFRILREQLKVVGRSDEVAQRSYEIAQNRYLISKISINELVNILAAKDEAKRGYLSALRNFWTAYYELRQLTLYDFQHREPIIWEKR